MKQICLFFFLSFVTAGVSQNNLATGLVLCLPLDGNTNDYSGNNNNGVLSGATPTVNRFGVANSAYHFNGSTNFISIPSSNSIGSIENNDELTITAWCKPLAWYPAWNIFGILEKYNPTTDWGWALALQNPLTVANGNDVIFISNYPAYYLQYASVVLGQWAFYSVTYSKTGQFVKTYKNGNLIQTQNNSGGQLENTGSGQLYIGYSPVGTDEYSNGDMDDIRVYDRALTDAEIYQLFSQQYSCSGELPPVADFSVSKNPVCAGQSVVFNDLSANTPTSWTWQIAGGTPSTSSVNNPTVIYATAGVYTISLTSGNNGGTSNTSVRTLTVNTCVSIEEWNNHAPVIPVYPNPANKLVYADCPENYPVLAYNMLGQKINVIKRQITEKTIELNFENNVPGLYFLKFFNHEGNPVQTSKLVIEN